MVLVIIEVEDRVGGAAHALNLRPEPRLLAGLIPSLYLDIALGCAVTCRDCDLLPVRTVLDLVEDEGDVIGTSTR